MYTAIKLILLAYVSVVFAPVAVAQTYDFRFTNPVCQIYGDKPKNAFCTRSDLPLAQSNTEGPFQKLIQLIRKSENKKITLATMSFSNKEVAKELCAALKRKIKVDVLVDSGVEMATAETVLKCGANLIKIGTVEEEDRRGDLHHNKFLLVEQNQQDILVFATANFSNPGLTINHETWSFISLEKNSTLVQHHHCLINALTKYKTNISDFKNELNQCRKPVNEKKSIESLFIPADSVQLVKLIQSSIKQSSRVLMTSNRYSFDLITNAFSVSRSKDSRAIFDDDLYWGGLQPTPDYINEAIDAKKLEKLEKIIPVRYIETSFGAAQKMHNKFIVLDSMVIVGAGNYTYAGMTSNFENFYIIRDAKAIEKFKIEFEYLWSLATDRKRMPSVYWDPASP